MHVLAIEPYYGGSHQAFLDAVVRRSRHHWTLLTGPARHWKWRMRNAPLDLTQQLAKHLADNEADVDRHFDLTFCSEMLDLAQWRGFLCGNRNRTDSRVAGLRGLLMRIAALPTITYFHENQWTYPTSPHAREDAHYGYTNLLTALASDEVWFNSDFHRREFLRESQHFVARMPDGRASHDLDGLASRSLVVPPGFEPVAPWEEDAATRNALPHNSAEATKRPLRIGWASRWEHDKQPDRFETLLELVTNRGVNFELILLGPRPADAPQPLKSIQQRYANQIRFSGFADGRKQYRERLAEMDVIVSTADHEFFGIAICEAISAGAIPVLPDTLSYPELVDSTYRYRSLEEAAEMIERWEHVTDRDQAKQACQWRLRPFAIDHVVQVIDEGIERVASGADSIPMAQDRSE